MWRNTVRSTTEIPHSMAILLENILDLEFLNIFFRKVGTRMYQLYPKINDIWKKLDHFLD